MGMTGIRRLEQDALGLHLGDDREELVHRDVVVMRALVIAPAHMQPDAFGRHVAQRMVQHLDMARGKLQVLLLAPRLVHGVAAHAEIGRVDLDQDAGLGDLLVFRPHGLGDGFEILVLGLVEVVRLEERDHAG